MLQREDICLIWEDTSENHSELLKTSYLSYINTHSGAFKTFSGWVGGWRVMEVYNKAKLSPPGAGAWAKLGNIEK